MAMECTAVLSEIAANDAKFYHACIVERQDITSDLWRIKVDPGAHFTHVAGQYATLGVVTPVKHVERAYSIVSAPQDRYLEFFIERAPHGELTPLLHKLGVGDFLTCRKTAKGRFTLDTASGRTNHLMISTVTGVAPFVSIARSLHYESKNHEIEHRLFLIDGASHSKELAYREEITRIAALSPWIHYVPTVSRPWDEANWSRETGRVDDLIRKYADSWGLNPETTTTYLCGNPTMIENCKGILKRRGWKRDAMREEAYFIPGHHAPSHEHAPQECAPMTQSR